MHIVEVFQRAKRANDLVIIEGIQALKHAVRFKAELEVIATSDKETVQSLMQTLAPDALAAIEPLLHTIEDEVFVKLSPKNHRTKVVALAKRQTYRTTDIDPAKPIVFLEDPKDLENIGAVIRVAAAADAGAVVADSQVSPWHPGVVRGGAGLQFAVPVFSMTLSELIAAQPKRKLISLDPRGEDITRSNISKGDIYIFGTERHGITPSTIKQSDAVLKLPMKPGVSSLNLATSVAATLYMM